MTNFSFGVVPNTRNVEESVIIQKSEGKLPQNKGKCKKSVRIRENGHLLLKKIFEKYQKVIQLLWI